jgi:hypothetical protein
MKLLRIILRAAALLPVVFMDKIFEHRARRILQPVRPPAPTLTSTNGPIALTIVYTGPDATDAIQTLTC